MTPHLYDVAGLLAEQRNTGLGFTERRRRGVKNGATMIEFVRRGVAFGLLLSGVTACASTPAYPIMADSAPAASPPVAAPPAAPADVAPTPSTQVAEPSQPVQSQPLAPVQSPTNPPVDQPAAPPAPQPRAEPRRPPAEPARYIATGKVIDAHRMYRSYKVRRGDHLDAIARDLETTPAILIEANHLRKPDSLVPGQRLKVPIEKVYVVQAGDTVVAVAKRFDVSAADLADLNVVSETHRLKAGDQLALPSGLHDNGPILAPPTRVAGAYTPSGGYRGATWPLRPIAPPSQGGASGAYPSPLTPGGLTLTDSQVAEAGRGRFIWPVVGDMLSTFGEKDVGRSNDGIDVKASQGAPVKAAAAGEVVYAGDQVPGFGNLVLVKHADGWVTAYAHLDKVSVKMREAVAQGQQIGEVGQSGGVSEPQLHFEVRYAPTPMDKARPVDPLLVLPK